MLSLLHSNVPSVRQATAILCLMLMILMLTGLPVPKAKPKDRSSPYPCMDSRCGCMTAEQCWKNCCCHTLEEKLAWAREHGVIPPDYILEQAAPLDHSSSEKECNDSCCKEKPAQCCNSYEKESKPAQQHDCCATESLDSSGNDDSSLTWVATLRAMKCHGQDGWMLLSQCLVVDTVRSPFFSTQLLLSDSLRLVNDNACTVNSVPDAPPPRLSR